ncbi:hypothetical protein HMPREF1544_04906 [Mucor circinelloides 1006PhL]|uniref:Alpha 1,4-glycosyltransferase domain-containing protein n=1 Tax=Mucor circinelloides f. circinelloides (strain 1006PhL) TaxID=1220926 RepID=S2JII9_MUCC1|nr:hypothetical protein HMPREF1544_04906 [Mucor circinelloides 1006PhL]
MFTTRSSSNYNKLPFYKSYSRKSPKQKQKLFWRASIIAIIVLFLLGRWHSSSKSTTSTTPLDAQKEHIPSTSNSLEVVLSPPASSDAKDFKELTLARETKLTAVGTAIPKIVHFVYGLRDPNPTLDLIHYTAIKAAHDVLKPDKIMFHYHYMPVGDNFERARPMLTLNKVPLVEKVFDRPVSHYAHRADVVRLQVLEEFGGIYLDLDLISVKPVDHLLDREFIMAQEGVDGSVGLCNAMIMARPHSRFVQRWFATYALFDSAEWNYHSVILPGKLAPFFRNEITVLNHTAFFWPLWDSHGLRTLYLEKSYDFSANLGTHIWESAANKNLMKDITEKVVMEIDNSLYCQIRPLLLDGKPDPRPGSCRILSHTERSDRLIGHWSLKEPTSSSRKETNPLPAQDDSGNDLNGLIRNGKYIDDSIYLSGDASYIFLTMPTETSAKSMTVSWWMKTSSKSKDQMAMVIQTDKGRIYVSTHVLENGSLSLNVKTVRRNDQWEWAQIEDLALRPSYYAVDQEYHHYALVINDPKSNLSQPPIALYMDGYVVSSSIHWTYPENIGSIVRGVWFGSIEPLNDRYQSPWDNSVNLQAYYREIHIWEKGLSVAMLRDVMASSNMTSTATTTNAGRKKKPKSTTTTTQAFTNEKSELDQELDQEELEEDEELLWGANDQLDD